MTRDEKIKLKVATIIDEAVGEKKKSRRRLLVWAGSACAAIMIASIAFALYLNNSPLGSGTSREFMVQSDTKNIPVERSYILCGRTGWKSYNSIARKLRSPEIQGA